MATFSTMPVGFIRESQPLEPKVLSDGSLDLGNGLIFIKSKDKAVARAMEEATQRNSIKVPNGTDFLKLANDIIDGNLEKVGGQYKISSDRSVPTVKAELIDKLKGALGDLKGATPDLGIALQDGTALNANTILSWTKEKTDTLYRALEQYPELFSDKSIGRRAKNDLISSMKEASLTPTNKSALAYLNEPGRGREDNIKLDQEIADNNSRRHANDWDWVGPAAAVLGGAILGPAFLSGLGSAANAVGGALGSVANTVGSGLGAVANTAGQAVAGAAGLAADAVGAGAQAVGSVGGALADAAKPITDALTGGKGMDLNSLIGPLLQIGNQIAGANTKVDAANAQMAVYQAAAAAELASYERAQQILGLSKDQAVSNVQAAALAAQGLINQTEAQIISTLNSSQNGAIATINEHLERQQTELNSTESAMMKGLIQSGLVQKEAITGSNLSAIKTLTGAQDAAFNYITGGNKNAISAINDGSDKSILSILQGADQASGALLQYNKQAIVESAAARDAAVQEYKSTGSEASKQLLDQTQKAYEQTVSSLNQSVSTLDSSKKAAYDNIVKFSDQAAQDINQFYAEAKQGLDPYTQLGERSALQNQYLSGLLTPTEKADYESKFGGVQESPLYKYQVQEAEQMLSRRQAAQGKTFSGQGATEFRNEIVDRIAAQEAQRQLGQANSNTALGYNAASQKASLAANQGTNLAGISQNQANQLGALEQSTGQNIANLQYGAGQTLTGLQSGLGTNLANVTQATGQGVAGAINQYGQNVSAINQGLGTSLANVANQASTNIANTEQNRGNAIAGISSNQGAQLGSLAQSTGQNISGIQTNQGTQLANVEGSTASQIANTQLGLGTQRATNVGNAGSAIANDQYGTGTALANSQQALGVAGAGVQSTLGSQLSNLNSNYGNTAAALAAAHGKNQADIGLGSVDASAQQSVANAGTNPLNIGLTQLGQYMGQQTQPNTTPYQSYQTGLGSSYIPSVASQIANNSGVSQSTLGGYQPLFNSQTNSYAY